MSMTMPEACKSAIDSMPPDGKKICFEYPDWERSFSDPYLFTILSFKQLSRLLFRNTLRIWPSRKANVHLHWRLGDEIGKTQHGYTSIETVYGRRLVSITLNLDLMVLGNWEGDVLAALIHHMAHAYFLICCGYREPIERLSPMKAGTETTTRSKRIDGLSSGIKPGGGGSKHSCMSKLSRGSKDSCQSDFSFCPSIAPRDMSHDLTHDVTYCTLLFKIDMVLEVPAFNYPNLIQCAPLRAMRPPSMKPLPWSAREPGRSYCDWNSEVLDFPMRDVQVQYSKLVGEKKQDKMIRRSQSK